MSDVETKKWAQWNLDDKEASECSTGSGLAEPLAKPTRHSKQGSSLASHARSACKRQGCATGFRVQIPQTRNAVNLDETNVKITNIKGILEHATISSPYPGFEGIRTDEVECEMKQGEHSTEARMRTGFDFKAVSEVQEISHMIDAKVFVKRALPKMAKHEIEDLRTDIKQYYLGRFRRSRISKYGSLSKCFTEQQLQAFMHQIINHKHKLLFTFMSTLGLRIGEAVKVNIKDVDFETRELKIKTEKARQLDSLIIPIPLFRDLINYIKCNSSELEQYEGYIFYREAQNSARDIPYMEHNYARNLFRQYSDMAGLNEVYDVSEEKDGRKPRRLHLLTTHSLRHYAITRFARQTNGNVVLTSRFARHRNMSTTSVYISKDKKELFEVIDAIAIGEVAMLKKKLSV